MLDRSTPPKVNSFSDIKMPVHEEKIYQNGIKIRIINQGVQEVSRIDIIMNGGQCEEAKCGTSSLTLKSLAKGTKSHNETEIAEILDFNGAWLDYNQTDHHSIISLYFTNKNFKDPLNLLKEIITEPSFPQSEFEILKSQTVEIIKSQNKKNRVIAAKKFNKILFGEGHPLSNELDEEAIRNLTAKDVAEFHSLLLSSPFSITLSGKIESEIFEYISELFCHIRFSNSEPTFFNKKIATKPSGVFTINKDDAVQATVLSGMIAPRRSDEEYIPLRILIELFGGFFGSRLNKNIRESKGLTYGISAGLLGRIDISCIQIVTDCDNKYVSQVIEEIGNEMQKIRKVKVEETELNILKSYLISEYVKMIDSPFAVANFINNEQVYGFPEDYFYKQIEHTKNITAEELQTLANKYLNPDNFFTIIVGNENVIKN